MSERNAEQNARRGLRKSHPLSDVDDGPNAPAPPRRPPLEPRASGPPAALPAERVDISVAPAAITVPNAPGVSATMDVVVAAEVLRRVHRTRQVVSLVSQLIIRGYDEEALHAETCRYLVTFGGYLMAWVGLVEEK